MVNNGKNINKKKINIKKAINYIADAWDCVTEEIIWNYQKKTGILPFLTNEDIDDVIQTQQEKNDKEKTDINQMIKELDIDDLYAALLINTLNNFFNDSEEILTKNILNEDDIIKLI